MNRQLRECTEFAVWLCHKRKLIFHNMILIAVLLILLGGCAVNEPLASVPPSSVASSGLISSEDDAIGSSEEPELQRVLPSESELSPLTPEAYELVCGLATYIYESYPDDYHILHSNEVYYEDYWNVMEYVIANLATYNPEMLSDDSLAVSSPLVKAYTKILFPNIDIIPAVPEGRPHIKVKRNGSSWEYSFPLVSAHYDFELYDVWENDDFCYMLFGIAGDSKKDEAIYKADFRRFPESPDGYELSNIVCLSNEILELDLLLGMLEKSNYYDKDQNEWIDYYYVDIRDLFYSSLINSGAIGNIGMADAYVNARKMQKNPTEIEIYTSNESINLDDYVDNSIFFSGDFSKANTDHYQRYVVCRITNNIDYESGPDYHG